MIAAALEKIGGALPKPPFESTCATNALDFVISLVPQNIFAGSANFPFEAAQLSSIPV
jgi:hypothetical protein